jgi:hypothetical protein
MDSNFHSGSLTAGLHGTFTTSDLHQDYLLADGSRALIADWPVGDKSITGIDTLTFTDEDGTIAGIANKDLLDKSATETVSGTWTFDGPVGIGTAPSNGLLEILNTGADQEALFISGGGQPLQAAIRLKTTSDSTNPVLRFQDSSPGQARTAAFNYLDSSGLAVAQLLYDFGNSLLSLKVSGKGIHIDSNGFLQPATAPLTIFRAAEAAQVQLTLRSDGGISTGNFSGISFAAGGTVIGNIKCHYFSDGDTELGFETRQASTVTEVLRLDQSGNAKFAGALEIVKSLTIANAAISSATTLGDTHYVVTCDASGGAFTVTLPAASSVDGRIYHIKKTDSSGNAVTVDGNSSETIDGDTTKAINVQYDSMMISCDGSNWHII